MMNRLHNEKGISLIEVLATLAILSIISILVFGVLVNGFDYSKKSQDKVSIQQEMNILITNITKIHESYDAYDIVLNNNPDATKIELKAKNSNGNIDKTIVLSNSDYEYSFFNYKVTPETKLPLTSSITTVNPLYIKVIIKDKKHPSETYEVKTIISRL